MNNAETKRRGQQVANYLQYMQALRSEMVIAMECISTSVLNPLQESIARQEALCAELMVLTKTLNGPLSGREPSPALSSLPQMDPAMAAQVRETSASLRQTNREYAALLKHSGRSLALFSSLCSTHTGQHPEARGPRSKYQTWSCEM